VATARPQTEAQWQRQVVDLARLGGWRIAHFGAARTEKGWRTPVREDGAGWPDLVLVHRDPSRLIFAELKATGGRLSPAQTQWLLDLERVAQRVTEALAQPLEIRERIVRVVVWYPEDFDEVRRVLLERRR